MRRYTSLKIMAILYKLAGIAVGALLALAYGINEEWVGVVIGILIGLSTMAFGELIDLFIHMAQDIYLISEVQRRLYQKKDR